MDKHIHAVLTCVPRKRHLLTEISNLAVNEFGESVTLMRLSTTGFWFWRKTRLELKVREDVHYLMNESVQAVTNAIMDRDGDVSVDVYEILDLCPCMEDDEVNELMNLPREEEGEESDDDVAENPEKEESEA